MGRARWLASLLGLSLVAAPLFAGQFVKCAEVEEEDADVNDDEAVENFNEEHVAVLTKDNFATTIDGKEFVLVCR
jgi:hypothetical protein